jgi:hypothetical protein
LRFLVFISFSSRRFSRADQSNRGFAFVGVGHQQKPPVRRYPDSDISQFLGRVIGIIKRHCQWVEENSGSFFERYTVFPRVALRFGSVPLVDHTAIVHVTRESSKNRLPHVRRRFAL